MPLLWRSDEDAQAAPARTQAELGPRPFPLAVDDVYEVVDVMKGTADPEEFEVSQATWLYGPRSAAEVAAARRAGEERIKPAGRRVGHVGQSRRVGRSGRGRCDAPRSSPGRPLRRGFPIGLERWTSRLVGASNVRQVTLFPRDRSRLIP